jgi:hypothetical protein
MRFEWVAAVALLVPIACRTAGDVVDTTMRAVSNREVRDLLLDSSRLEIQFHSPIPTHMVPGERISLSLEARHESGEVCQFCEASWTSRAPEVVSFSRVGTCTEGRCSAVLEGVAVGTARLAVRVCQTYERDCEEWQFAVKVQE